MAPLPGPDVVGRPALFIRLEPGMRYMGSKAKHAKEILQAIQPYRVPGSCWVEPFVGGGNMICNVTGPRLGADTNRYIVALLAALAGGWVPPDSVSEVEYQAAFDQARSLTPQTLADHELGFIAFGCSFGGKYFGGYARGGFNKDGTPRNYASESRRNMIKMSAGLTGATLEHCDYRALVIPHAATVYCDPPYAATTKYKTDFDHTAFWQWCEALAAAGRNVFVSEYQAPPGWVPIWRKTVTSSLDLDTGSKVATESVFMLEAQ